MGRVWAYIPTHMDRKRNTSDENQSQEKKQRQTSEDGDIVKKRTGYLEWDEYFMAVAFLSSQRSKDPRSQVSEKWATPFARRR